MKEILLQILSLILKGLNSETWFVTFSIVVITTESIAIWALIVLLLNKSIIMKREEIGLNEVNKSVSEIKSIMFSHYLKLAEHKFGDDYFNRKETALYRFLLTYALEELLPIYRARVKKNHFNEKTAAEWTEYVSSCIRDDINLVTGYIDEHYHPQARIQRRPDLYEWNQSIISELKSEGERLFSRLLEISTKNKLRKFFGLKIEI